MESNEDFNKEEKEMELESRKWKHRRRLAYMSFISMMSIIVCIMFFIPEARLSVIEEPIIWSLFTFGGIVAAYMGFSTWDGIRRK